MLKRNKIAKMTEFPSGISLGELHFANFSDAPGRFVLNPGLVSLLHRRLGQLVPKMSGNPSFHADHGYRWPHVVWNLLWTDASLLNQQTSEGTFYFPNIARVVSRERIAGEIVAFAAKGRYNEEPHNKGRLTMAYDPLHYHAFCEEINSNDLVYRVRLRGIGLSELAIIDLEFHCDLLP